MRMKMALPDTIEARSKRRFPLGKKLFEGDLADLYASEDNVIVKIARDPRDNDLLENEARVLSHLYPARQKDEKFYHYLPKVIDTGMVDRRHVTVFPYFDGFVSLAEIIAAYPSGVDFRDMTWMYKRLLAGLGFAREMGVIHGAILPPHVLVHPTGHDAKIIDWSYALVFEDILAKAPPPDPKAAKAPAPKGLGVWDLVRQNLYADEDPVGDPVIPNGAPLDPNRLYVRAISVDYSKFYAPEILRKETPSPASDIYMAAKCAVALLGGDVETNVLPDSIVSPETSDDPKKVRAQIQAFLQASLLPNPHKRPQDAWQVHEDFDNLLLALVGKPTYRPFSMPGGTP